MLDETSRWVNLSDGGHLENLATMEPLRRQCKFIIIDDGEADPHLQFNGLATLIRTARIDLGVEIDINLDKIRLKKIHDEDKKTNISTEHWAMGTITYPNNEKVESRRSKVGGRKFEGRVGKATSFSPSALPRSPPTWSLPLAVSRRGRSSPCDSWRDYRGPRAACHLRARSCSRPSRSRGCWRG